MTLFQRSWAVLLIVLDVTAVQAMTVSQIQVARVSSKAEPEQGRTEKTSTASRPKLMRKESLRPDDSRHVDIDVYYETRCPGCLLFLNKTLEPLWRHQQAGGLGEIFKVNLYTYGNGMTVPLQSISDGYKFWHPESTSEGWSTVQICQHGNDECLGNLVQVCAKNVTAPEKHMELVFCMTGATIDGHGVEKASYDCMEKAGIDKDKVKDCVTSPRGNQLLTSTGETTNNLKGRRGTPWVMVGGRHVRESVLMNSTLLLQSVCSIAQNVPEPCAPFKNMPDASAEESAPGPTAPDFTVLDGESEDLLKVSSV